MHTRTPRIVYFIVQSKTFEKYHLDLSTQREKEKFGLVDFPNEHTICELFVEIYRLEIRAIIF